MYMILSMFVTTFSVVAMMIHMDAAIPKTTQIACGLILSLTLVK